MWAIPRRDRAAAGGLIPVALLPPLGLALARLVPAPRLNPEGPADVGEHLRLRAYGQSGSEFHSLREYMIGDDLRRIHWPSSARTP